MPTYPWASACSWPSTLSHFALPLLHPAVLSASVLQVFFTKVPPTVTQNQLIQLFTACGEVAHLELFIPWPGAKISRGCGLVEFTSSSAAAAAVHSMHQQFTWPHSHSALVVEWVDRNRQSANNAKKARACATNGFGMTGSPGSMPVSNSLRADHQAAAAAGFWRPAHAGAGPMGFAGSSSMPQAQLLQLQQQAGVGRNSHSCPLPQLPPGWQVVGTAQQLPPAGRVARPAGIAGQWAAVPTSLGVMPGPRPQQASMGTATYLQQPAQLQHGDSNALVLQQQMLQQQQTQRMGVCGSDAGSAGTWMACPATSTLTSPSMDLSSLTSLGSVYDASVLSGSTYSSTVNSAANSGALQSQLGAAWDKQQQAKVLDLTAQNVSACSAGPNANAPLGNIPFSEPMMAATAAAMSGNSSDAIWQQLLQQNVMLFQTMTPPPEEEAVGQHMLLPSSAGQQQAGLQAAGMVANTSRGMNSGMPAYLPMQSQAQQLSNGSVVYTGSAIQPAQQTRQQMWWLQQGQTQQQQAQQSAQQQQAQAGQTSAVVALPLSQRQLAAMAGVLPEVPALTGAQAWISSAATGGLQLCLSGTYSQLQAGHTAVAMLLGKAGIDEPLAPAVVHAAAT